MTQSAINWTRPAFTICPAFPIWMECVKSRQKPITDVETGARSVTVCHLLNLAYWNHRKLKWDPQNWEFDKRWR